MILSGILTISSQPGKKNTELTNTASRFLQHSA